ncbi:hypothetical protein GS501_02500 [Saccharibacter sp. 17.LH.SD]|uniref:hypothetical protein n=1 Tax=Saccharibacter sp. 17.LH.SD TaxID=2689393 RepID=UPI001367F7AA|nr:hypothetical protein [Saccharibacter sp. 17.LH.SD]MXV43923.1 hypothetical protein [Saccharibacter sp. 17.LH.SD]
MSLHSRLTEERRWRVLDFLEMAPGHTLNEDVVRNLFREAGFHTDVETLRADIDHLEKYSCVTLTRYRLRQARYLLVIALTSEGQQTWQCERFVPGVIARKPL